MFITHLVLRSLSFLGFVPPNHSSGLVIAGPIPCAARDLGCLLSWDIGGGWGMEAAYLYLPVNLRAAARQHRSVISQSGMLAMRTLWSGSSGGR